MHLGHIVTPRRATHAGPGMGCDPATAPYTACVTSRFRIAVLLLTTLVVGPAVAATYAVCVETACCAALCAPSGEATPSSSPACCSAPAEIPLAPLAAEQAASPVLALVDVGVARQLAPHLVRLGHADRSLSFSADGHPLFLKDRALLI